MSAQTTLPRARRRAGPIAAKTLVYVFLILLSVTMLVPLYWTIMTSLMDNEHIYQLPINFFPAPDILSFSNYVLAFEKINIFVYLKNSVIVTGLNIVTSLLTASMGAYAVSKIRFRGSQVVYRILLASMMVPGFVMLVPTYLVIDRLGMMDTLWSLIVPGALSVYGIFFMRSFLLGVGDDVGESARMDGAGELRVFFWIYVPQIKVGLIILGVNTFSGSWNAYLTPSLYLKSDEVKTLVVALKEVMATTSQLGVTMAFSLLFSLPVFLTFVFVQKYFMTGFAIAGIKS